MKNKVILCLSALLSILTFSNIFSSELQKITRKNDIEIVDVYSKSDKKIKDQIVKIFQNNSEYLDDFDDEKIKIILFKNMIAKTKVVIDKNKKVLGFTNYTFNPGAGFINYTAIALEHRRKGYGTLLNNAALQDLFDSGCKKVTRYSMRKNKIVHRFLKKRGYKKSFISFKLRLLGPLLYCFIPVGLQITKKDFEKNLSLQKK
ncbi:GNAT family N-acetyltransferase [bacterium]|nr:GNAT family N-acetyltransferase [bacterium]